MSGCFLSFSIDPREPHQRQQDLDLFQRTAFRTTQDVVATVSESHAAGVMVDHGLEPSWGISSLVQNRYRLILCGWAWEHETSTTLCSPDAALDIILRRGWTSTPSLLGQYLLIFLDTLAGQVVVENDLLGLVPCYYRADDTRLVVSSELKIFPKLFATGIDVVALAELVRLGHIVTDRTLLTNVKRLFANQRVTFDRHGLRSESLPFPPFPRNRRLDDDALEELSDAFGRYLDRVKSRTSKVSASLSGGMDSRVIVAALVRRGFDVTCFSAGEPGSQECQVAAQFSQLVGCTHVIHEFDGQRLPEWFQAAVWITETRCHPSHMHFLDAMLSGHFPRLAQFHGFIGDVVIGGDVDQQLASADLTHIEQACKEKITDMNNWPPGSIEPVWGHDVAMDVEAVPDRVWRFIYGKGPWSDSYTSFLWFRYLFRLFGIINPSLGSQVLPWIPLLAPYVDPTFFRIAASLRYEDVAERRGQVRWILRTFPEVARLPRVKDGALIPIDLDNLYDVKMRGLLRRRKLRYLVTRLTRGRVNPREAEGYPNYNQWYRKWRNTREFVNDTLLSRRSLQRGLWREPAVRSLLKDLRIGRNVWPGVSTILQLEVLLGQLFDGDVPSHPGVGRH